MIGRTLIGPTMAVLLVSAVACSDAYAEVLWVAPSNGAWEVAANWLEKDSAPPVHRVPSDGGLIACPRSPN